MHLDPLTAISPIDGRYATKTEGLRGIFSEYGLIYHRLMVEVRWLQTLSRTTDIAEVPEFSESANTLLDSIVENFDPSQAQRSPPEGLTDERGRRFETSQSLFGAGGEGDVIGDVINIGPNVQIQGTIRYKDYIHTPREHDYVIIQEE